MGLISNGTTLLDAGALSVASGPMTHIKTLTASSSATLDFLNGVSSVVFDGTYDAYVFKFINIHPATDAVKFTFQADTGTNTNYNQAITSTMFESYHAEGDGAQGVGYETGHDQAQGTAFEGLCVIVGNDNDQSVSGTLRLFNPSSSVFVKHFMSTINCSSQNDNSQNDFKAGYFNTTTALTRVRFKMSSGNIDSGTIKLYGIT